MDLDGVPEAVLDGLNRVGKICKCFSALLSPVEGDLDDVTAVRDDTCSHNMEMTARSILNGEGHFAKLMIEHLQKGASAEVVKEDFHNLMTLLQTAEDNKELLSADDLASLVEGLPKLRTSMRTGATDRLEVLLLKQLRAHATAIMSESTADDESQPKVSAMLLNTVLGGLGLFVAQASELLHKLDSWKTARKAGLGVQELTEALVLCEKECTDQTMASLMKAHENLGGWPAEAPVKACLQAFPSILHYLKQRASWQRKF
eukprot:s3938_g3.t1